MWLTSFLIGTVQWEVLQFHMYTGNFWSKGCSASVDQLFLWKSNSSFENGCNIDVVFPALFQPRFETALKFLWTLEITDSGSEFQSFMAAIRKKLLRIQVRDLLVINLHRYLREFLSYIVNIPSIAVTAWRQFKFLQRFASVPRARKLQKISIIHSKLICIILELFWLPLAEHFQTLLRFFSGRVSTTDWRIPDAVSPRFCRESPWFPPLSSKIFL